MEMKIETGKIYTLTQNRGAGKVIEKIGKHHVVVEFADGAKRKINICSIQQATNEATDSPPTISRPKSPRKIENRRFSALKDKIRDAVDGEY